jgi:hypothetical protein
MVGGNTVTNEQAYHPDVASSNAKCSFVGPKKKPPKSNLGRTLKIRNYDFVYCRDIAMWMASSGETR